MKSAWLLDTNVLSELMRKEPAANVLAWFAQHADQGFAISTITRAEIQLGIALLPMGKKRTALEQAAQTMFDEDFRDACLPFDAPAADIYARLVAQRTEAGLPISTEDAQIAAIAIRHKLVLVTRNTRDFHGIDQLAQVDPWSAEHPVT